MQEPVLPADTPRPLDHELLAWAAGFFDGEGTTSARTSRMRPDYAQLDVSVSQSGPSGVPEVLVKFQRAMLGTGRIYLQSGGTMYKWWAVGGANAERALALMWPFLGTVKRRQASVALERVRSQYTRGIRMRSPKYRPTLIPHEKPSIGDAQCRLAWAAGFLDGEGSFCVRGKYERSDGTFRARVRVSASQHGEPDVPAEVLTHICQVLGMGRIERHGDPDDFRWVVEGAGNMRSVLDRIGPWLGTVKQNQAAQTLSTHDDLRVRGDAQRCIRGHLYDSVYVAEDGMVRQRCSACARITARAKRMANGEGARVVRNRPADPTRIYRME